MNWQGMFLLMRRSLDRFLDLTSLEIFLPLRNACLVPKSPTDRRQSRRVAGDSRLSMSVTLTSDHSKIFFAAVTAAFAAPPPGRTATAAPHWPLHCRCTAARSRRPAALPQPHSVTVVGDSSATRRHVSACGTARHAVCRRGSTAAALRLPVPASLRRCTAAALPPQSPHRVRTDSAVPPLPRHPVCRRAALPRVPAVPPHCGALES